ncbi:hypothetical protein C0J52_06184 [Blattella germanica]|nr:hypothetical protein C0J52_06184 [Blattella germanica]
MESTNIFQVARDDKLPKKICDDCMFKLDSAYQFWNTTANAEKQLLQWLGEVSNEDKKALVLKEEAVEQETSDITKTLSRVEAVLDDERGGSDDEDTESEEEGSNSEDSGDDEPPGKEEAESEEEEEAFEPLEPTTFVNVSLAGSDEAGPSGIQQPAQTATSAQQQMAPPPSQQQQQVAPSTSSAVVAAAPVVAAPSASG